MKGGRGTAKADEARRQSVIALIADLVGAPSRAGRDDPAIALDCLRAWLSARDLPCHELRDEDGRVVALAGLSGGDFERPAYFLNATIDTAGFGNAAGWHSPPSAPAIRRGRLYGRGSGDSKAGVAIFCHVFERVHRRAADLPCALGYVFDAEEHSGRFTGMRRFLDTCPSPIAGVMIGYPGFDRIVTGARGFWRATARLLGELDHSGSSHGAGVNAIGKAAHLVDRLASAARQLDGPADEDFPLPPKLTVTGIRGGGEFSLVPDLCELDVDIRLTPRFGAAEAEALMRRAVEEVDAIGPAGEPTVVDLHQTWPAYRLPADSALAAALVAAAGRVLGRRLPTGPCGPSNVGNLLATRGIEAVCGFGVRAGGVHGVDEWIDLATVAPVLEVYDTALAELLGKPVGERAWRTTTSARKSFA